MHKIHSFFLSLVLLTANISVLAEQVSVNIPLEQKKPTTPQLSPQAIQDIYTIVLKHLDTLESILDSIGQSLASGASRLTTDQKKVIQDALQATRTQIELIKQATTQHVDLQALCLLTAFVSEMINTLQNSVNNKLLTFAAPNEENLQKQLIRLSTHTLATLDALLQENELSLIKLNKDVDSIGLSTTNQAYRKLRSFAKKYSLYDVTEHAVVYSAFLAWCAYITPQRIIDDLANSDKFFHSGLGKTLNFFNVFGKKPVTVTGTQTDHFKYTNPPSNSALPAGTEPAAAYESHGSVANASLQGDPTQKAPFNSFFEVTIADLKSSPLTIVPVGSLFASYFTGDAKALYKHWTKARTYIDNYLYGTAKQESFEESTIPKERFKDIVGREEIKAELSKIVEYIAHPDRYNRADIKISRGYLLAGSPQTGKTFMARALAGEISDALQAAGRTQTVRFFDISTDNLKGNGISSYINLAKHVAPCILFFDELDLARLQRDGDSGLLSAFLQGMNEGLSNDEKDQVFILGVTNKPSNLDFALLQPGRFSKVIYFEKPTFQHRIDYFQSECAKRCMNMNNFDFKTLAQLTEGCHFGALKQVIRTACMNAKIEGSAVTQQHFERAIATEIHQIIIGAPELPAHKERLIAIHQAGKAIASILLNPEQELCQITVLPVTQTIEEKHVTQQYKWSGTEVAEERLVRYGDIFSFHTNDSLNLTSQQELLKRCKITLAGNAAQLVTGLDQCIDHTDRKKAFEIAKKIILGGLDARDMSRSSSDEQLTKAWALLTAAEQEVVTLLTPHKAAIEKIADALQKHKTLTASQVKALI